MHLQWETRLRAACQWGIDLRSNSIREALAFLEVTLTLTSIWWYVMLCIKIHVLINFQKIKLPFSPPSVKLREAASEFRMWPSRRIQTQAGMLAFETVWHLGSWEPGDWLGLAWHTRSRSIHPVVLVTDCELLSSEIVCDLGTTLSYNLSSFRASRRKWNVFVSLSPETQH